MKFLEKNNKKFWEIINGILPIENAYAIIAVNKRNNRSNGNEASRVPALEASSRLVVLFSFVMLSI